jgi:hypothetical protein
MDSEDEEEYRQCIQEWEKALKELQEKPLSDYGYVSFTSRSAGRNKKRKRLVEVEFITLSREHCVSLMNGHFPKKKKTRMDSVAEEALGDTCPPHIDPLDYFLYVLRQREMKSKN